MSFVLRGDSVRLCCGCFVLRWRRLAAASCLAFSLCAGRWLGGAGGLVPGVRELCGGWVGILSLGGDRDVL